MIDPAAFRIGGTEIEATQAGKADRLGAHRAGLQGDVQIAIDEPRLAEVLGRSPNHQHFGVRRGIAQFRHAVAGGGQNVAGRVDQHGAHRNLAPRRRGFSFGQRALHECRCLGHGAKVARSGR